MDYDRIHERDDNRALERKYGADEHWYGEDPDAKREAEIQRTWEAYEQARANKRATKDWRGILTLQPISVEVAQINTEEFRK